MTLPESRAPDRPFPGAHSQVPGAHEHGVTIPPASALPAPALPLEASRASSGLGWAVRLPVRAEYVTVTKAAVVRERVVVRRRFVPDGARVQTQVLRERLRVDTQGQVDVRRAGAELVAEPTSGDDASASARQP